MRAPLGSSRSVWRDARTSTGERHVNGHIRRVPLGCGVVSGDRTPISTVVGCGCATKSHRRAKTIDRPSRDGQ
jgi:hypothetical protein